MSSLPKICVLSALAIVGMTSATLSQEPAQIEKEAIPQTRIFQLAHADASDAANLVNEVFGGVRVAVDRRTNGVVISAPESVLNSISAFFTKLDAQVASDDKGKPEILRVPNSAPRDLMNLIGPLVSNQAHVSYNADAALLVIKGSSQDLDNVGELLKKLQAADGRPLGEGLTLSFYLLAGDIGASTTEKSAEMDKALAQNAKTVPASLQPAIKSLIEGGFRDPVLVAPLIVRVSGDDNTFRITGMSGHTGIPVNIEIQGRAGTRAADAGVDLDLTCKVGHKLPAHGDEHAQHMEVFSFSSRLSLQFGEYAVVAEAPVSPDCGMAGALVVTAQPAP